MTDNLELWKLVEKTDPKQVKAITGKPYKGNSPKPHYLVQKATETFGPCGIGWGFEILNERVEEGAAGDKIHIAHIGVWYEWKDKRGKVEHVGQTMLAGKRRDGTLYTDEDAPKKSVTDALVKALSMIGFAGDIFMGRYDDSKYVQEIGQEFAAEERAVRNVGREPTASVADYPHDEAAPPKLRDNLKIYKPTGRTSANSLKQDKSPDNWDAFEQELAEVKNVSDLTKLALSWSSISERDIWPTKWHTQAKNMINERREELINGVVPDDDVFPGDRPAMTQEQIDYLKSHPVNGG